MANLIIIEDNWKKGIIDIAEKFNNFAKKGSLRMLMFLVDKAFDIASDDSNESRYDASNFLQRVRAVNPKLISSYISTFIDARAGSFYFDSPDYVTPDYMRAKPQPLEKKDDEEIKIYENVEEVSIEQNPQQEESGSGSELLSWDISELIKYKIVKNLAKTSFEKIKSPIKKCACGDGVLEEDSVIWRCTKCDTAYHENCAKIVAILEGYCRICEEPFIHDELKIKQDPNIIENNHKNEDNETNTEN